MNKPEYIIIHHTSGTDKNPLADTSHHTYEIIRNWHMKGLGWEDIGYHWVIEKYGKIVAGLPENVVGSHCIGMNFKSIGVVVCGNFDLTKPTKKQEEAFANKVSEIRKRYKIPYSNIIPHRFFSNKTCYGNNLSDSWAKELVLIYDIQQLILKVKQLIKSITKLL
jgi:N-acetylmuramoyl-L-alanine amidase CwlA